MVSLVNSYTNATRIGWHLWEIDGSGGIYERLTDLPLGCLQGGGASSIINCDSAGVIDRLQGGRLRGDLAHHARLADGLVPPEQLLDHRGPGEGLRVEG